MRGDSRGKDNTAEPLSAIRDCGVYGTDGTIRNGNAEHNTDSSYRTGSTENKNIDNYHGNCEGTETFLMSFT